MLREINTLGITQNIDRFFPKVKKEEKKDESNRERKSRRTDKRLAK